MIRRMVRSGAAGIATYHSIFSNGVASTKQSDVHDQEAYPAKRSGKEIPSSLPQAQALGYCFFLQDYTTHRPKTHFGLNRLKVLHSSRVTGAMRNSSYKRFRELLSEARKTEKLTQAELSERLGRPQSFVSKYERGERRLDVIEFAEIASALGIDPLRFLAKLYREIA
ncbi:MAG TPA: helix-turn-helix transcriptional regulator [Chthoniobacterales bacterium]|nr:helix-turn-helix transcriptional regulator [Chthoniobacterales bacterium]